MKLSITILMILVAAVCGFAQGKAQPNQWKGLTLDETTADEIINRFGKPNYDKIEKVIIPAVKNLLTAQLKQKKWRMLNYKSIESVGNTLFVFDANSRVVLIHFELKDLSPKAFVDAYGLTFKPVFSGFDQAANPSDFLRDSNGNVYAKNYPTTYYLLGISEKSFVVAGIADVPTFGGIIKRSIGVPDSTLTYPGKVLTVELISRTLEDKNGVDNLK